MKDFKIKGLYLGPSSVAEALGSIYRGNTVTVRVLDIAAGTGILGEKVGGFLIVIQQNKNPS